MQGYCMKCKKKTEINNPTTTVMKNGRLATNGICSECGTKMFRIEKKGSHDTNREDEIRQIAYYLWKDEGCHHGHHNEYWARAEVIWQERHK